MQPDSTLAEDLGIDCISALHGTPLDAIGFEHAQGSLERRPAQPQQQRSQPQQRSGSATAAASDRQQGCDRPTATEVHQSCDRLTISKDQQGCDKPTTAEVYQSSNSAAIIRCCATSPVEFGGREVHQSDNSAATSAPELLAGGYERSARRRPHVSEGVRVSPKRVTAAGQLAGSQAEEGANGGKGAVVPDLADL